MESGVEEVDSVPFVSSHLCLSCSLCWSGLAPAFGSCHHYCQRYCRYCEPTTSHHGVVSWDKARTAIATTMQAGMDYSYISYESGDGGLTWTHAADVVGTLVESGAIVVGTQVEHRIKWGRETAQTPQGEYRIDGSDIVLVSVEGEPHTVYSAAHLGEPVNVWFQAQETGPLGDRRLATSPGHVVFSDKPRIMTFDPQSGNVVLAMGIQGVVVGTSQGEWTPVSVGPYSPTEFSPTKRAQALLSSLSFWTAAVSFSLALTALALVTADFSQRGLAAFAGHFIGLILVTVLAALLVLTIDSPLTDSFLTEHYVKPVRVFFTALTFIFSFRTFIDTSRIEWEPLWWINYVSVGVMICFIGLSFVLWSLLGGPPAFAEWASFTLCVATAITLTLILRRTITPLELGRKEFRQTDPR